ncbi:MAG: LPS assembly lipoprotein LptE [Candidatus Omnitrophota bacterium]
MSVKKIFAVGCLLGVLGVGGAGCQYTSKTVLPSDMKTIYVRTVKNAILLGDLVAYEPGTEMEITNAVIRRLHQDGNLKVVSEDKADVILDMSLIRYEQEGTRFSRLENVQEYRLFVVMSLQLIERTTGHVLWEEPNFSGDTDYFVGDMAEMSRDKATHQAIDRLARNIVDRIVEDW